MWVYVLERQHAIKVLKTLMGNEDPELVRQSNANSLHALYGTSENDNAIIGSPDTATAKDQISVLFSSWYGQGTVRSAWGMGEANSGP